MISSIILFAVLTRASDLTEAMIYRHAAGVEFALTGTVNSASFWSYPQPGASVTISDGTGGTSVDYPCADAPLRPGDVVALRGTTVHSTPSYVFAKADRYSVLGHATPQGFRPVTLAEVFSGRLDYLPLQVGGTVMDAFRDEIDPDFLFLILNDGKDSIHVAHKTKDRGAKDFHRLIGSRLSVKGICYPTYGGARKHLGRIVQTDSIDPLTILKPAPADVFNVPELGDCSFLNPMDIAQLGRRRASGRVVALYHGNRALLKGARSVFSAEFAVNDLPAIGSDVEVTGFPESDSYQINVLRAEWRPTKIDFRDEAHTEPADISARQLVYNKDGKPCMDIFRHGKLLRLSGTVRRAPDPTSRQMVLEDNGELFAVDVTAIPAADALFAACEPESRVRVTGICLMVPEVYRGYLSLPKINGFTIAVRRAEDLAVIAGPPWWTPGRLFATIGILLASLFLLYLRNRFIRRLAATRIGERNRLAADLHDSITQNLTGAILQLDAARMAQDSDAGEADRLVATARKTLESSIGELRRCIWDLRTDAIGLRNFEQAIRLTLQPIADAEILHVRFPVDRADFTDALAHVVLSVIRELVSNAVQHGRASSIRIAGAVEGAAGGRPARLLFSVVDDGCGFAQERVPGTADGHFGLSGIRERVKSAGGTFNVSSEPGRGTSCRITMPLP